MKIEIASPTYGIALMQIGIASPTHGIAAPIQGIAAMKMEVDK